MAKLLDNMSTTVQMYNLTFFLTDFMAVVLTSGPTDLLSFLQCDKWLEYMLYVLVLLLFLSVLPVWLLSASLLPN